MTVITNFNAVSFHFSSIDFWLPLEQKRVESIELMNEMTMKFRSTFFQIISYHIISMHVRDGDRRASTAFWRSGGV